MQVQTKALHFSADRNLLEIIEKKIRKLERFFERITVANVTLKLESTGRIRDRVAEVQLSLPGSVLFVRVSSKSFEASVDSAVVSLRRQLVRYKDKPRVSLVRY
jgi:putative sigma-54 modulation protein